MSYILDALRRADAERDRGAVPGLYTQPALADGAAPERALWPWAATAVVVVAGGVALVNVLVAGPESTPGAAQTPVLAPAPVGVPAGPMTPPAVAPSVATQPAPAPSTAAAPSARAAAPAAPPRNPPVARPREVAKAPPGTRPGTRAEPVPAPPAMPAVVPVAPPKATDAEAGSRVLTLNELSDDVRRSLPALAINGASYSETPAHRMLIANGQVYREGEEPAPGLVLEQIRAKSAVLRWRGVRYSVPY
jgi:general secretion pathway protein B